MNSKLNNELQRCLYKYETKFVNPYRILLFAVRTSIHSDALAQAHHKHTLS